MENSETKGNLGKPSALQSWWFENAKWLIGTIGLGVVSLYINARMEENKLKISSEQQDTQLQINLISADADMLGAVLGKLPSDTSAESRLNYLRFIKPFISYDSTRLSLEEHESELRLVINNKQRNEVKETSHEVDKAVETNEEMFLALNERTKEKHLYEEKPGEEKTIETLLNSEKEIVMEGNFDQVQQVSQQYARTKEKINNIQKKTALLSIKDSTKNKFVLYGEPQTKWCKPGYFVVYGESTAHPLKIGVEKVEEQNFRVNMNITLGYNTDMEKPKEKLVLEEGQEKTYTVGNSKFIITLDYIGAAGYNPLKKAAYITVTTYQKPINTAQKSK